MATKKHKPTDISDGFFNIMSDGAITHELKIWPEYFYDVVAGTKKAEIRKTDRAFRAGDVLFLREWNPTTKKYTGACCTRQITDIVWASKTNGIKRGYAMLSIKKW